MSSRRGKLFVISGPSGCGKSTICREVAGKTGAVISVSATTRPLRDGERNGVDYTFISHEEFTGKIKEGWFYEHAEVYGELYGTPKEPIERGLADGKDFFLDIDVQGALNVRRACADAVLIFVSPPNIEELRRRLEGRATESKEALELRMSQAISEMNRRDRYNYTILNKSLERAIVDVLEIVETERKNGRI